MARGIYRVLRVALSGCLLCLCVTADAQKAAPADSLQAVLRHTQKDTSRIKILVELANAYAPDDVTKEFYYANEVLSLSGRANWDKGKMYAERLVGDCYNRVMAYNDAMAHFQSGITIARKLGNINYEIVCLQLMLHSYHELNDVQQVLACQRTIVDLAEKTGEPDNLSRQMRAYGLFLSEAGSYHEAIDWLLKDVAYTNSHFDGDDRMNRVADILNVAGGAYIKIDRIDSALYCLRMAAGLANQTGNDFLISYINSTFCDVYAGIKRYDSAIIYGECTIKMGEAFKNLDLQQYYCKVLSQVYEENREPGKALYYYKRYDSLISIINNTQKTIGEAIRLAKINIQQQAEKNAREKKAFEIIRRNQQAALVAACVAVVALVLLIIFVYYNLRQKQKANKTISMQAASLKEQNQVIDKALKEKEVLLKETHHRVKNNLQLISSLLELQAANQEDESAKAALRTAQRRVQSIATVHSKLYGNDDSEAIEFSSFTGDLFARLENAFGREGAPVRFANAIPATFLPLNTVVLLGLILNELITNSFKHAFKNIAHPEIKVSLEFTGSMYSLRYYDNGIGLPEGLFNTDTGSLGLYLIKRLSKQLKGMASYKSDAGSIFTIIFPDAGS